MGTEIIIYCDNCKSTNVTYLKRDYDCHEGHGYGESCVTPIDIYKCNQCEAEFKVRR